MGDGAVRFISENTEFQAPIFTTVPVTPSRGTVPKLMTRNEGDIPGDF
jgi:hypothetical protein